MGSGLCPQLPPPTRAVPAGPWRPMAVCHRGQWVRSSCQRPGRLTPWGQACPLGSPVCPLVRPGSGVSSVVRPPHPLQVLSLLLSRPRPFDEHSQGFPDSPSRWAFLRFPGPRLGGPVSLCRDCSQGSGSQLSTLLSTVSETCSYPAHRGASALIFAAVDGLNNSYCSGFCHIGDLEAQPTVRGPLAATGP